ncbi:MAG TPA: Mth938-like domain-containing protein [Gammaproteobacteria bacterium]
MRFSQDTTSRGYTIHAVTANGVMVKSPEGGSLLLRCSFIISAESLITDWEPRAIDQLQSSHFAAIVALQPEVVLLGTGARLHFPPPALLAPLMAAGIGCEVMDGAAACRTSNVLNGEGRKVVAALLFSE